MSIDDIEAFIDRLERELQESGRKEIPCTLIGERVMAQLREWYDVAYVRFASVYRRFKDITEFMDEIKQLADAKAAARPGES